MLAATDQKVDAPHIDTTVTVRCDHGRMAEDKKHEDDETAAEAEVDVTQINHAYRDLLAAASANIAPDAFKGFAENFASKLGLDKISHFGIASAMPPILTELDRSSITNYEVPEIHFDTSPQETAENTERIARQLEQLHDVTAQMVTLTATNLALTEQQREGAARMEQFSRRATWASIVIGAGSLVAAVAAIVVTIAVTV